LPFNQPITLGGSMAKRELSDVRMMIMNAYASTFQ
jgi:hypothetical protein